MATSYVFLAEGFEEIEAIAPTDIMRRAGMDVKLVSISDNLVVTGANGAQVKADLKIADLTAAAADEAEWLVTPGGMPGATNLAACGRLTDMLVNHWHNGGNIASICASPAVVLAPLGILRGLDATCYPSFKEALVSEGATYVDTRVVDAGNVVTSNGPSSALLFGYTIVGKSLGEDTAQAVASGMLY